jgi:hypothetical protein
VVRRLHFEGRIAGAGSTSGVRVVVGAWHDSPFGPFADAMVETRAGHRVLLAPSRPVADFVAATYVFDEVRVEPVIVERAASGWRLTGPSLTLELRFGDRTGLGRLLRLVPARVATHPAWASAADPVSRIVLRGVRTRGVARAGRREWYGATDVHAVVGLTGRFDGTELGELRPVDPPCRFGFSSTPRRPSVTDVVTTVDVAG